MAYAGASYYLFSWVPPDLTPQAKVLVGAEIVRLGPARDASVLYDQIGWGYGDRERKGEKRSFDMAAVFDSAKRKKLTDNGKTDKPVGQDTKAFGLWLAVGAAVWAGVQWLLFTSPHRYTGAQFVFVMLFFGPLCFGVTCLSKFAVHIAIDRWVRGLAETYKKAEAAGELPASLTAAKARRVPISPSTSSPYRRNRERELQRSAQSAPSASPSTGQPTPPTMEKQGTGVQGTITMHPGEVRSTITLSDKADASTFMHLISQNWLKHLMHFSRHEFATDKYKADAAIIRRWLKLPEDWTGFLPDGSVDRMPFETFASGFKRYLMEGVAPSRNLRPAFARFKQQMTGDPLDTPINDEIRGVFDRMLSEPQQTPETQTEQPSHQTVIRDYGDFMARRPALPTRIEDVSVLPHPKELILNALLLEIGKDHPEQIDEMLRVGAMSLAQYQAGVGTEPLEMLGMDLSKFPRTTDHDELRRQAKLIVEAQSKTKHRFDQFNKLVGRDLQQITSEIAQVKSTRKT